MAGVVDFSQSAYRSRSTYRSSLGILSPELQSEDGRTLREKVAKIFGRNDTSIRELVIPLSAQQDVDYTPMIPNPVFTATVRYQYQGRGEPLPYPLDDE